MLNTTRREAAQRIPAELSGTDTCTAIGHTTHSATPVLAMCRELLAAGLNPDSALLVYRKGVLALRVRSIAEGAGLEVNSKGTDFVPYSVRTAPPIRLNAARHPKLAGTAL